MFIYLYLLKMSCIMYVSKHKLLFLLAPTEKTFPQTGSTCRFFCRSCGKFFRATGQRTLGCCGICRALLLVLEVQRSLSHFRCWYRFLDVTFVCRCIHGVCVCLYSWDRLDVIFADKLRTISSDLLSTCIVY